MDTLTVLAADDSFDVRRRVAANPNTAAEDLARLAADTDTYVRWRVAANPGTPTGVIRVLAHDPHSFIADTASTIGQANCLHRHAATLTGKNHDHARLLITNGFPGWPDDLASVLTDQRNIPLLATRAKTSFAGHAR